MKWGESIQNKENNHYFWFPDNQDEFKAEACKSGGISLRIIGKDIDIFHNGCVNKILKAPIATRLRSMTLKEYGNKKIRTIFTNCKIYGVPKSYNHLLTNLQNQEIMNTIDKKLQDKLNLFYKFINKWSANKLKTISLSEYTNLSKTSFTYDVETKMLPLGEIGGISSFIFGIYKREDKTNKQSNNQYFYTKEYAWYTKYGDTKEVVFENIKNNLNEVVKNAQKSKLSTIELIDLPGIFKWKVAFLYQNLDDISIVPVFKKEALELYIRDVIGKNTNKMKLSELYQIIKNYEKFSDLKDALILADIIWDNYKKFLELQNANFNILEEKEKIDNDKNLSNYQRTNATSELDYVTYSIKEYKIVRRNFHNQLEKSFKKYLENNLNATNIKQNDACIDIHFEFNNKKYICELKPSENQKEICCAIQNAVGQILRYSYDKNFDFKVIVFQNEPDNNNLQFLEYLKKEHKIYYLYEQQRGVFKGNILND